MDTDYNVWKKGRSKLQKLKDAITGNRPTSVPEDGLIDEASVYRYRKQRGVNLGEINSD